MRWEKAKPFENIEPTKEIFLESWAKPFENIEPTKEIFFGELVRCLNLRVLRQRLCEDERVCFNISLEM